MKRILILSDTHSYIDDDIRRYARNHDEVWHAGDWGDIKVYDELASIKRTVGVYGNIDSQELRIVCPKYQEFTCEQVSVLITHIGGYPNRYNKDFREKIQKSKPNLVICGHSHILKVMHDKRLNHLHINPGAIGLSGFHQVRTMISLEIEGGNMRNLKVIEFDR